MTTLLLKFEIDLDKDASPPRFVSGPAFHRWLPDGEEDAIALDTGDPNAHLKVWFERRGFVQGNSIMYDYERREVDEEILSTQGLLSAGPLMGLLEIRGLPEEELAVVRENRTGDQLYIAVGRQVVKKWVYLALGRFVDTLRISFGQHWIRELPQWDSRTRSVGNYCRKVLGLMWSLDGGESWRDFLPDDLTRTITLKLPRYSNYLTKEDWRHLAELAREGYEPSTAAALLARTHQFLDEGNLKHALIEGVSALEAAVREYMGQELRGAESLREYMKAFWQMPLRAQAVVASVCAKVDPGDIENTVQAIKTRGDVVHKGLAPPPNARTQVIALRNTVSSLLSGPGFRFPSRSAIFTTADPDDWDRFGREDRNRQGE